MRVFVDDERLVNNFDFILENAEEFFQFCTSYNIKHIDVLSLDHDLGDPNAKTGYDIVKQLPNFLDSIGTLQFHTANPVGFENMLCYAKSLKKHGIMKINNIVEEQLDSRNF